MKTVGRLSKRPRAVGDEPEGRASGGLAARLGEEAGADAHGQETAVADRLGDLGMIGEAIEELVQRHLAKRRTVVAEDAQEDGTLSRRAERLGDAARQLPPAGDGEAMSG